MTGEPTEVLHRSVRTTVSRVACAAGPLIRKQYHGAAAAERARAEAAILRRLAGVPGVPRLVETADPVGTVQPIGAELFMADAGHRCLADFADARPPAGDWLVGLAGDVAGVLAGVHAAGVQHRDISPWNILVAADGTDPRLIDFGLATTSAQDSFEFTHPSEIAGTLPYLAPELTGRTGGMADHRADLYGLGAVLYRLATGHPPFGELDDDPLELIHAHLARVPVPPHEVNPDVPVQLSRIVLRLLEKEPDRRYCGAEGLAYDLARLSGGDDGFELGARDFPARLAPPSRLIGREPETARLASAFRDALGGGAARGVLVGGPPGVGKTALLDELRPLVTMSGGGWFVAGKSDQYRHDQVDDAVVACLRGLGRLLLAEPDAECAALRERLRAVLGSGVGALAALLPEVAVLLGIDQQPGTGDGAEATQRTYQAFVELLAAVTVRRPVVMVLDDLQWASGFTLGALDAIVTHEALTGVLVVGGYRDTEVDAAHPLTSLTERWRRLGAVADVIGLRNLPAADQGEFLGDMLRIAPDAAADLAGAVAEHAAGNPFDTVELVNALRREGGLVLGADGWQWDARDVRRFVGDGDVLQLVGRRVDALPDPARDALATMACLGGAVEVPLLSRLTGGNDAWQPALEEGLLVLERTAPPAVRFRHDRVQQAMYASMPDAERVRRQLGLARTLAGDSRYRGLAAEQYLACEAHLDEGSPPDGSPADGADAVLGLFTDAADQARRVGNYEVAERYLAAACRLAASADVSADDGGRSVRLAVARHGCLAALRRFDEGDELFAWIQANSSDDLLLAGGVTTQLGTLTGRGRFADCLALGTSVLARLGWPVPDAQTLPGAIPDALDQLRLWADDDPAAGGDGVRDMCDDPRVLAAASLIDQLVTAGFFSGDPVWIWLVGLAARLWRTQGRAAELTGALGHAAFATIVAAQDYRTGYRATRRLLEESSGLDHPTVHAHVMFLHTLSSAPWFEPMPQVVAQARAAREALVRGGDPWAASFTYFASASASVWSAATVAEWEAEAASGLAMDERTGNDTTAATLLAYRQAARALAGRTLHPGTLSGDGFDADAHLAALGPNVTAKANYHWCCAHLAAVFGDRVGLDEHSAALMPLLAYVGATQVTTGAHLLRGLACAWRLRVETAPPAGPSGADQGGPSAAAELEQCRAWLASRAGDFPGTFAPMVSLLDAEGAWASGDLDTAAQAFERACAQAEVADLPGPQALVLERYGRLLLERGLDQLAGLALQRARWRYAQWGAVAKVAALDEEFGDQLDDAGGAGRAGEPAAPATTSRSMTAGSVDLLAVLQAFQILSTQTTPARLQEQVSQVLAMLTGATQVRLVLWDADSGGWVLPRPGADGSPEYTMLTLAEAAAGALVPLSAFRYVERTGQTLVVADAAVDPRFAGDPYFEGVPRCALLAVPVLIRGVPRAVLLLENRLARGAFSARRLDAVQLITGELSICLDNMLAERFRSLVQRSADLTVVCDREGTISYASSASAELLGVEEAVLVGRRLADVAVEEDAAALAGALASVGGQARPTVQVRVRHADGQPRWVEATLADLTADPAVGGIMGRLHDITERHRLEIELRHAQKLESVGQLASGIAHEINTPMQFISSNLHFLTDAFGELIGTVRPGAPVAPADAGTGPGTAAAAQAGPATAHPAALRELLEEIPTALAETIEGTERVITIVRAMKAFGHPGGDDKREVDLNEAVRMTLVVAANEIRSVADIVTDLGELPPVRCTVGDINQVVLNLVVNAVHAMADRQAAGGARGTLTVRTRRDDADVLIEVGDTGVGIPPEIAHRVFDQFFTTKPVGQGTGQGLALAHALVHDHHGGNLDFASTPGVGTVFTVRLPISGDG